MKTFKKSDKIKSLFETYFDGCHAQILSTYSMGICKLDYNEESNTLTVYLRRPELLIGKGEKTINKLKDYLGCNIDTIEVKLF